MLEQGLLGVSLSLKASLSKQIDHLKGLQT